MPAAKLFTLNSDSSTSGEPSVRVLPRSYTTSAHEDTEAQPAIDR